jgi:hypothetical protein
VDTFTGLGMPTAGVDRVMEATLRGDPLSPTPLEGAIQEQDQGLVGHQESLDEQLHKDPA